MRHIDLFFRYARARHEIYLRRQAGQPREQWTRDPILMKYRFTNVFRELDKTTDWFRRNVRDPMRDRPEVFLATVVFRMFNRIETGEAIFCQKILSDVNDNHTSETAFEKFLLNGDVRVLKRSIVAYVGRRGPYTTGGYIISSPPGYSKLDGVLKIIGDIANRPCSRKRCEMKSWACAAKWLDASKKGTLERTWNYLREFDYTGPFHSYEIVTDLRHTCLLEDATDIMTWANVGPGARRGLNRVFDRPVTRDGRQRWGAPIETEQALEEMREILEKSRLAEHWPQFKNVGRHDQHLLTRNNKIFMHDRSLGHEQWSAWELRDVEHTLCEFDKYERVRNGEGSPRGVYR